MSAGNIYASRAKQTPGVPGSEPSSYITSGRSATESEGYGREFEEEGSQHTIPGDGGAYFRICLVAVL